MFEKIISNLNYVIENLLLIKNMYAKWNVKKWKTIELNWIECFVWASDVDWVRKWERVVWAHVIGSVCAREVGCTWVMTINDANTNNENVRYILWKINEIKHYI